MTIDLDHFYSIVKRSGRINMMLNFIKEWTRIFTLKSVSILFQD